MAGDYASELESIARELRRQADGALFRELTDAMRRGVEPAIGEIRSGLEERQPEAVLRGNAGPGPGPEGVGEHGRE